MLKNRSSITQYQLHKNGLNFNATWFKEPQRTAPLGILSNLDDELSGRRPEVFSRTRQLLRMSVMSSTWRSGRDIC